jgi:large subunit ribosomal protein L22e
MVSSRVALAKRYVKYLTKKFLKKIGISDYIKINATEKSVYRLKYIAVEKNKEN